MEQTAQRAASEVRYVGPTSEAGGKVGGKFAGLSAREREEARGRVHGLVGRQPSERTALDDERLREVERIYREAVEAGASPTLAVAHELYVSRASAGRYVMKARQRGFLPTTTRGRVTA